jgi:CRISPR-associated endonuclease/helicase Cas3
LFHDFGKAGMSFQETLNRKSKHTCQPYRHEWISVRLFQAFVGEQTDEQWLASLEHLNAADEKGILKALKWITGVEQSFQHIAPSG